MKSVLAVIAVLFSVSVFAQEPGFYVKGVSAETAKGAAALVKELSESQDPDVCYEGDYESALNNVHSSISISVLDVYGESEFPPLDAEVTGPNGESASGIINACN